MSKVEDLANKYCEGSSFEDACMEKPAYIAGYHQATEDICEWLKEHSQEYVYWMDEEFGKDDLINDLKKHLEGKK